MSNEYDKLSKNLKEILNQQIWYSWSAEQRDYILIHEEQ